MSKLEGGRERLQIGSKVKVGNKDAYGKYYVGNIINLLQQRPIVNSNTNHMPHDNRAQFCM